MLFLLASGFTPIRWHAAVGAGQVRYSIERILNTSVVYFRGPKFQSFK